MHCVPHCACVLTAADNEQSGGWVQQRIMEIGRGCPEIPPSSVNTIIAPPAPAEDDDDAAPCCRMMMMLPPVAWGDIVKRR